MSASASPAQRLVALAGERGVTLAVAESLTGGGVCDALVAVPGASRVLRGGVVAYASDLKSALLGVDAGLLARHGAVHAEVASAMARGVRDRLGADYGLATTGVAGPDPGDGYPPGTFHVAVSGPGGEVVVRSTEGGDGDEGGPGAEMAAGGERARRASRDEVRAAARDAVLVLAIEVLADGAAPRG